jgi:hypothetical protein
MNAILMRFVHDDALRIKISRRRLGSHDVLDGRKCVESVSDKRKTFSVPAAICNVTRISKASRDVGANRLRMFCAGTNQRRRQFSRARKNGQ